MQSFEKAKASTQKETHNLTRHNQINKRHQPGANDDPWSLRTSREAREILEPRSLPIGANGISSISVRKQLLTLTCREKPSVENDAARRKNQRYTRNDTIEGEKAPSRARGVEHRRGEGKESQWQSPHSH